MAKRFFSTSRIEEEWYLNLSLELRELLRYCESKCDNAGVFSFSEKVAATYIGKKVTEKDVLSINGIIKLRNGKYFITHFLKEQNGKITESSPAQKPIFNSIRDNGLGEVIDLDTLLTTLPSRVLDGVSDTHKNGIGIGMEGGVGENLPPQSPESPKVHPLQKYVKTLANVSKLKKQLTYEECERLIEKFPKKLIEEVLLSMENRNTLTKDYQSVNLTIQKWCGLEIGRNPEKGLFPNPDYKPLKVEDRPDPVKIFNLPPPLPPSTPRGQ